MIGSPNLRASAFVDRSIDRSRSFSRQVHIGPQTHVGRRARSWRQRVRVASSKSTKALLERRSSIVVAARCGSTARAPTTSSCRCSRRVKRSLRCVVAQTLLDKRNQTCVVFCFQSTMAHCEAFASSGLVSLFEPKCVLRCLIRYRCACCAANVVGRSQIAVARLVRCAIVFSICLF